MPDARRRPTAARILLALAASALLTLGASATDLASPVRAAEPDGIDYFLWALGRVESGGRYTARNAASGAYGKYQILPSNWPSWARRYLGDARARPTPRNQERVARGRVRDLYRSLEDWSAVAHWWLTGRTLPEGRWSGRAERYVTRVMGLFGRSQATGTPAGSSTSSSTATTGSDGADAAAGPALPTEFQEASSTITYTGTWRLARHAGYSHGRVRYATQSGASASITFFGSSIAWQGPVGPTRGRALVYLDGVEIATVDLRRPAFRPSTTVFRYAWPEGGRHTLTIEVLGSGTRRTVALDAFVVG